MTSDWRYRVLEWMEERDWHLKHPVTHHFWEWVVMPRHWGGRLGFKNWVIWSLRDGIH